MAPAELFCGLNEIVQGYLVSCDGPFSVCSASEPSGKRLGIPAQDCRPESNDLQEQEQRLFTLIQLANNI